MNEDRPRGIQFESYRNYKATKRLFTNTQNSAYYNNQSEVCWEIDESAECDIHLFWMLWKGHTKKKHSICKQVRTNNITYRDPTEIAELFLIIIVKFPIPAMSVIRMVMVVFKIKFRIIS
jgi:hypothetical protein